MYVIAIERVSWPPSSSADLAMCVLKVLGRVWILASWVDSFALAGAASSRARAAVAARA